MINEFRPFDHECPDKAPLKCGECGFECDNMDLEEAPEDRICCDCANIDYDGSCIHCRQRIVERMQDSVDK